MRRSALALVFVVACGSSEKAAPRTSPPPETTAANVAKPAEPTVKGALRRVDVKATVKGGLGTFLQRATLADEPVLRGGKFVGFRLLALDRSLQLDGGLLPGDVVTHLNGFTLEHPEEALTAFKSLEVASEVVVAFERNGEKRELRIPIVD